MSRPVRNLRLFVGLYPPPPLAEAMLAALDGLDLPPRRPTPGGQVHLTLQFVGDVPVARLDETVESVTRAAAGLASFELRPDRLITLPERGPSRLVAAETDRPATLLELQRRLAQRLARAARARAGDRFRPHLTLCRFRAPARGVRVDAPLDLPPFAVRRVVLMRSTLRPEGAEHHEVAAAELDAG